MSVYIGGTDFCTSLLNNFLKKSIFKTLNYPVQISVILALSLPWVL